MLSVCRKEIFLLQFSIICTLLFVWQLSCLVVRFRKYFCRYHTKQILTPISVLPTITLINDFPDKYFILMARDRFLLTKRIHPHKEIHVNKQQLVPQSGFQTCTWYFIHNQLSKTWYTCIFHMDWLSEKVQKLRIWKCVIFYFFGGGGGFHL